MGRENGKQNDARRPKTTLAREVDQWRTLADRCGAQLADMPHVAPVQAALREAVGRIQQSFTEQAILTAQLSAMFERRRRDVAEARDLRNRLAGGLVAHYGPGSDSLRLYGLKPRCRRARARQKAEVAKAN